jgi:hypothetical protein
LQLDAKKRTCTVSAVSGKHMVNLIMTFPALYPNNAAPTFTFGATTTVTKDSQAKLAKVSSINARLASINDIC